MILPTTATAVLAALIISLIGWGSWACLFKAAKKSRFEFFAYDFAWGVIIAAVVAAFTLGSWDSKDLTFQDNFLLSGYRKMAWALGSGVVFSLANLLLMGSMAVSRMAVAFPAAFGIAWAVGGLMDIAVRPGTNLMLSIGGAIVALIGAILASLAFKWYIDDQTEKALLLLNADPHSNVTAPRPTAGKGLALAAVAGLFLAVFFYGITEATTGDNGVSAYGAVLLAAAGIFGSSIVFVPFFLNFPVRGKPLTVRQYIKVEGMHHILGVFAGIVWTAGLLGGLVAVALPEGVQLSPIVAYMLPRAGPLLAILWGMLVFREFPDAQTRVQAMMGATFVLLLSGMGMIAVAPVFGR